MVAEIGGERLIVRRQRRRLGLRHAPGHGGEALGVPAEPPRPHAAVVVGGDRVYASHGEENIDGNTMGRVVCIDGRGRGDVTATHEVWRYDALCGYASPALADGVLYVIDNSGNLHALDAGSGQRLWHRNLGTVGRGSPVAADGKLYATTVNGRLHILRPGETDRELLDSDEILAADGGPAEIFGSPAVAGGRVYFTTDEGLYCLGGGSAAEGEARPAPPAAEGAPGEAAGLLLIPAESTVEPGASVRFEARLVDAMGRVTRRRRGGRLVDGGSGRPPQRWRVHCGSRPRPRGRGHPHRRRLHRQRPGARPHQGIVEPRLRGRRSRRGGNVPSPGTGSARRAASFACAGWRERTCSTSPLPAAACSAPTSTSGPRT